MTAPPVRDRVRAYLPYDDTNFQCWELPPRWSYNWAGKPWCKFPHRGNNHPCGWCIIDVSFEGIVTFWCLLDNRVFEHHGWWWSYWQRWKIQIRVTHDEERDRWASSFRPYPQQWWWEWQRCDWDWPEDPDLVFEATKPVDNSAPVNEENAPARPHWSTLGVHAGPSLRNL